MPTIKPTVLIVGSLNMDYPGTSEPRASHHNVLAKPHYGGRAVNYAFQLSRLGAITYVFGSVGKDPNGQLLKKELTNLESCTSQVKSCEDMMTGVTFFTTDPPLQYFHVAGANQNDITKEIQNSSNLWGEAHCCLADLEILNANVEAAFSLGRTSPRINILDASYAANPVNAEFLKQVDVLIVRKKDVELLLENDASYTALANRISGASFDEMNDFYEYADAICKMGPKCVLLSFGGDGCLWGLKSEGNHKRAVVVGLAAGLSPFSPYPNSAHAAFSATVAFEIARARASQGTSNRDNFLLNLDWGHICRRGMAAYIKAARRQGASESMPSIEDIDAAFHNMETATRTIVSIDIVNSTERQADSTTPEWRSFKQKITDLAMPELLAFKPKATQWVGDGFWIVFDGATNGVSAALNVLNRLQKAIDRDVRIGINTGDVVIGADNTAQGLPASLAKRVESAAKKNVVTIAESTKMLLNPNDFSFSDPEVIKPDDKHANEPPITVYTVARKTPTNTTENKALVTRRSNPRPSKA